MVYSFLIVNATAGGQAEILYSQVFSEQEILEPSEDDLDDSFGRDRSPSSRRQRKRALQTIADRVTVEYRFIYSVSGKNAREETERLRVDGILPEFTSGVFGLVGSPGEPVLDGQKHVVWSGALGTCCAVLVLESEENRLLAESCLETIFRLVQMYCRVLNNPREVQLKPDYVMVILKHFLPGGRMTFSSGRLLRQFEKELEKSINALMSSK